MTDSHSVDVETLRKKSVENSAIRGGGPLAASAGHHTLSPSIVHSSSLPANLTQVGPSPQRTVHNLFILELFTKEVSPYSEQYCKQYC